ncbi:MAG: biotin/lipoyl-binding protein [Beijerinckiaceae bacterium]
MDAHLTSIVVPALREDLRLHAGSNAGHDDSTEAHWLIYDPLAHRYHEIDTRAYALLQHWQGGMRLDALSQHLAARTGSAVSPQDLFELVSMLNAADLLADPLNGWKVAYDERQKKRKSAASWLLHNYLFVRIPLVRPDAFLARTLPVARALASPFALLLLAVAGIAGLYMVSRQWDAFTQTFLHFFSLEGAAGYLLALAFVKVFHELGHAYVARHFGCRVPTMGLALMVLAPVLYTDVTDAWRLSDKRARLLISAAGMLVEFAIAIIATLLWAFLPEGFLKSACFFIATVSWVMSLVINLSPLMRFDGYYLLSDYLGIANLQPRAFALMRWRLREILFDLGAPCPEDWSASRRRFVLVYAVITSIYRLFLFFGIALLVYHMTFKVLGILLFAVEILWFIVRPVTDEMRVWWRLRGRILAKRRYRLSATAFACAALAFAIPWPHRIEIPSVIEPVAVQRLAVPVPARVTEIHVRQGDRVRAGEVLYRLDSPKLNSDLAKTRTQLDLVRLRYARRAADQLDRDATITLQQDIARLEEKLAGLRRVQEMLVMRAAFAGIVHDVMPDLHSNLWAARGDELAAVTADQGYQVRGYLSEDLLSALSVHSRGRFVPDAPLNAALPIEIRSIAPGGTPAVELPHLRSTYGGAIAVHEDKERGAVPIEAQYQVVMAVNAADLSGQPAQRGVVLVDAQPESLAVRIGKRMLSVLIREAGF